MIPTCPALRSDRIRFRSDSLSRNVWHGDGKSPFSSSMVYPFLNFQFLLFFYLSLTRISWDESLFFELFRSSSADSRFGFLSPLVFPSSGNFFHSGKFKYHYSVISLETLQTFKRIKYSKWVIFFDLIFINDPDTLLSIIAFSQTLALLHFFVFRACSLNVLKDLSSDYLPIFFTVSLSLFSLVPKCVILLSIHRRLVRMTLLSPSTLTMRFAKKIFSLFAQLLDRIHRPFHYSFVCSKCKGIIEGTMDSIEKLCDEVETVNGFCYLGDRLNASGGCEAAVTARVRIGWVRFRECREFLLGNRFPLKMKGKIYCCVRSAILYESETWCPKENEKAILRRTERAMVRAMCGQKVVDRKTTEEQMDMLGLKETIDRLATANGVRWYGHVLRRDDDSVLRVAVNLEVSGKRKRGRPKKTWRKQVEEKTEKIGLKKEDAIRRDKWRD